MSIPAVVDLRFVPHPPVCPECGSGEVTTEQVDMSDDTQETAYLCTPCGAAWPLACICEWSTRHARR